MKWASVPADRTCEESYIFDPPVSPHLAAEQQGITIDLSKVRTPASSVSLVIEGAGGVLAPINDQSFMLDLIRHIGAPVIIAARSTLGTINHTLLTVSAVRNASLDLRGVVMIGRENADNRRAVERYGSVPVIGSIPWLDHIDRATLRSVFAQRFDVARFQ
jgi:dethiobiotin synthetase